MRAHVDVMVEPGVELPIDVTAIESVTALVIASEQVTRPCMVSVSVVSDERMRELNLRWRGIDRVTDVLSLECERPDDPDLGEGEPCELGDVVLAPHYVVQQALRVATTPASEFTLLLVHGLLHLLGYDHLNDDDASVMEAREDELVAQALGEDVRHVAVTRHGEGEGGR